MKRSAIYLLFVAIMVAFTTLSAKAQDPVTWEASIKMTSPTEGVVTLVGTIELGWHVYGTSIPDVGPQPTKLSYAASGLVWDGNAKMIPVPTTEMDPMFEAELNYWENHVTFNRKFTCTDPSKVDVTVGVTYMCCNDSSCRPPKTEKFNVKVTE